MERFSPQLLVRRDMIILGMLRDPTVLSYTVGVANTLDNAQGVSVGGTGVQDLFTFYHGRDYISKSIQRSGRVPGITYTRGDFDRAAFTFDEFYDSSVAQSVRDNMVGYLTVTRTFHGGGTDTSPILIVPPFTFYGSTAPTMTLYATAPLLAYTPGDPIPQYGPLIIQVPMQARNILLRNESSTSSDTLYLSYGDFPAVPIGGGSEHNFRPQTVSDIHLFGNVNVPFSAAMAIALGKSY
jgi:hypothetical protein